MIRKTAVYFDNLHLESGEIVTPLVLSYTTIGTLNETKSNVVWVCHALTGNANPTDWWGGLFGEKKIFDPQHKFIICVNVLGSCYGSSGPLSINHLTEQPYYDTFPQISIRDIVNSFELLRIKLKINTVEILIGGSLGGQQAVEWAIYQPQRIKKLVLIATNAKHSSWGIAFNESQRMAIRTDITFGEKSPNAGKKGLSTARSIALLSYRNYNTYVATQIDKENATDNYKAASYQQYQGEKFIKRFNAYSYWILSKTMDSHNVARKRKSIESALHQITAKTTIIGINSDILFPPTESKILAKHIPNNRLFIIDSIYGHDGFLLETEKLTKILKKQQLT